MPMKQVRSGRRDAFVGNCERSVQESVRRVHRSNRPGDVTKTCERSVQDTAGIGTEDSQKPLPGAASTDENWVGPG